MILFLRVGFSLVVLVMLVVTGWASTQVALWKIPASVGGHPWFIATLFDAYFAFLTFWLWVAYKERAWPVRIAWLIAILLLGNMAMAGYMLIQLFDLPRTATLEDLVMRRKEPRR